METELWKGCFIAESLKDPTIINNMPCTKIWITDEDQLLDDNGNKGRWHMYWIETTKPPIELFKINMRYNWYGHFWNGNRILAIFENKVFELDKNNEETWKDAIEYGKTQGILEEQLDFLTE
jgi:hypothetical protein